MQIVCVCESFTSHDLHFMIHPVDRDLILYRPVYVHVHDFILLMCHVIYLHFMYLKVRIKCVCVCLIMLYSDMGSVVSECILSESESQTFKSESESPISDTSIH